MWQLKFRYTHKDCVYSPRLKHLGLVMYGYPLSHYFRKRGLYLNGLQILRGDAKNIQKYVNYLQKHPSIKHLEQVGHSALFFQAVVTSNVQYYKNLYNQKVFYPTPVIHEKGREIFTIACWERKPLQQIFKNIQTNKNTSFFELLHFKRILPQEIFLPQLLPKLTAKQQHLLQLAKERGYWNYPRKTDLNKLAQELHLAKSTVHEKLKRAEARLLEFYM